MQIVSVHDNVCASPDRLSWCWGPRTRGGASGLRAQSVAELSYAELRCSVLQLLFLALALSEITWRQDGRPRHPGQEAVELGVLARSPTHFKS